MLFKRSKLKGKTAEEWVYEGYRTADLKKQVECYTKSLKISPKSYGAWTNKGWALYRLGKYEEAIKCYDKALKINPKGVEAWENKGLTLYELGKYEEAIKCYDKVLRIDPVDSSVWGKKGQILNKLKEYDKAIECLDMALEIGLDDDDYGWIIEDKGAALVGLGKYEEAIKCYDKALKKIGLKEDGGDLIPLLKMGKRTAEKKLSDERLFKKLKSRVESSPIKPSKEVLETIARFENGDYSADINKSIDLFDKAIEKIKPEIFIEIPESKYYINRWSNIKIYIKNTGNANAKNIKIFFSKELEAKETTAFDLEAGEEKEIEINAKPLEIG
ncbi:MAG: hypothetical protein DRN01_03375, partial [Thermoplasmata archaeon]